MIPQGDNINTAKPIALTSHMANIAEKHYPLIYLEVTLKDFALQRFRNFLLGSTKKSNKAELTDHQPLKASLEQTE